MSSFGGGLDIGMNRERKRDVNNDVFKMRLDFWGRYDFFHSGLSVFPPLLFGSL